MGLWIWLSRRAQKMMMSSGAGPFGMLRTRSRRFEKPVGHLTFDDVAGLASAKRDLQEIIQFLKDPRRFQRLGGKVPRGVLLVGPPGTGKTLLARAVAGEAEVPFFSISGSEFIEMFVGVGAARVRELFEEAKKSAPAIIFIDEIDAVGRSRTAGFGASNDEREQTLNQLLSEMDGFGRNDLTIVLAATNRPDILDSALLRPGRFDRRVIVDRPELPARRAILGVHTREKPLAADVDLDDIAKNTPGFSGADLANLANEAALGATRRGAETIAHSDFSEAYDKIVLGDPRETKLDSKEKRRVAVHEAGHAVVAHFTSDVEPLRRVTIIPRGVALGVTQQSPAPDRHLMTRPELDARLRMLLGGYAAESLVLGFVSTGAENDLREATGLASKMVAHFGMSENLGTAYYDYQEEHPLLGQKITSPGGTSDATIHAIEDEVRRLLATARDEARELLTARRAALDTLVTALLEHETIEHDDLIRLLAEAAPAPKAGPAAAA
jgi:cell division protease FtsH